MKVFVFLSVLALIIACRLGHAQPASVVLWETTECLGCPCGNQQGPPDGSTFYLMWDVNSNGADPADSAIGTGTFDCDDIMTCLCGAGPFNVWSLTPPNSYWVMVAEDWCCWSSATFSLTAGPQEIELDGWTCVNDPCFTDPWVRIILSFVGCMEYIGCPCTYPEFYPEGSQVQLMRALPPPGPMGDEVVADFETSRGAGLPPWDCNWTPVHGELEQGTYYVFSYSEACCWVTDYFPVTDNTPIFITEAMWHCTDAPCLPITSPPVAAAEFDRPPPLRVAPNPFNPSTSVEIQLGTASHVNVAVCDIAGREVVRLMDATITAGTHELRFDGALLPSGIYFATLTTNGFQGTTKLLLLK